MILEKDGAVFVLEPIGWFIGCVDALLSGYEGGGTGDDDVSEEASKLTELLETLTEKYANLDAGDLNLDKSASYARSTLVGRTNALRVDSIKNLYESLMGRCINQRSLLTDPKEAETLMRLQKKHRDVNQLLNSTAATTKKAKKLDDTIDQQKKLSSQLSQPLPEHCISFKSLGTILKAVLL